MNWWKELKGKVRLKEPLIDKTTFKIGGRADFFISPQDTADLKLLLVLAKRQKLPVLMIGAGSNILIKDGRLKAVVVKLDSPHFEKILFKGNVLEAGSGLLLSKLIRVCKERGLSGSEFLTGIPGTLGGAAIMNAGIRDRSIGDLVEKIRVMDYNGRIKNLTKKAADFRYRSSNLGKYIILSATLKFSKKNKREIKDAISRYMQYRRCTQGLSSYSAGCVFKNPAGGSAGSLIDLCGLKGERIGGACISRKHANFIMNSGKAKARDVLMLMGLAKRKVRQKFGINLEPEIKIWK